MKTWEHKTTVSLIRALTGESIPEEDFIGTLMSPLMTTVEYDNASIIITGPVEKIDFVEITIQGDDSTHEEDIYHAIASQIQLFLTAPSRGTQLGQKTKTQPNKPKL